MPIDVAAVNPEAVRRKVAWRVLPLIFCIYLIAYLDRANLGFVKTRMQLALDWPEHVMGWGIGLFFAGYLILEIPGALLVEHWSARKWFARILLTWGVCSMGVAFVQTPWQFYTARFLLGLAEAGFFPGVIVYFTHWFPRADRARALSAMVLGIPISLALGARVSGLILEHDWSGWSDLAGWQWVFVIEGCPALLFGLIVPFVLVDRPRQATWLTKPERDWLEDTLQKERDDAAGTGKVSIGQALKEQSVWILALGIFTTNIASYVMVFWLPTFMENLLKSIKGTVESTEVLNTTGLVYLCGLAGAFISGQSSDRFGERKWHCIAGQVLTGLCLGASIVPGQPFAMTLTWLCMMGFFASFWPSPFWVLPTLSMSASAAAVSIGFINIFANFAGMLGSPIVGHMKTAGFTDRDCLIFPVCCYILGGIIIATLRVRSRIGAS